MRHPLRVLALACALAATPACASLQFGETRIENPIAAAHTLDQRAYAMLHAYAAVIEEATDIVRDPGRAARASSARSAKPNASPRRRRKRCRSPSSPTSAPAPISKRRPATTKPRFNAPPPRSPSPRGG